MGVINLSILVEKLKKAMSGGFVSKTDYPSGDNAGVIKVDSVYATEVTSGGKLKAKAITSANFSEANDNALISKKTLDNLKAGGYFGGGSGLELVLAGDYTESADVGDTHLRTTGKDLTQYKLLFVNMGGSSNGSCSCVVWDVTSMKSGMGYYLNENGGTAQIQYTLAKSSGSEIYDSIYVSHGTTLGKWGNIYGIK